MEEIKPGYYTDEHGKWYYSGVFWYIGSEETVQTGPYAGSPHYIGAGETKPEALKDLERERVKRKKL